MLLAELALASQRVAATASRTVKVQILAGALQALAPGERAAGVAFLCGELPDGRTGVGWATLRALAPPPAASATATVGGVAQDLARIGAIEGKGASAARREALAVLLGSATASEQDFLRRLLLGELRQGALEGVVQDAVAQAASVPPERLRRAAMLAGSLPAVAAAVLEHGARALDAFRLHLLRPVQPMLAQSASGIGDALERLGTAALEWKLDGARIQVHRQGDAIAVFTRTLHDVTAAVPEVVEAVRALPVRQVVLDGEALALRPDGGPQPFQTTMRRFGRRLDVASLRAALPLRSFLFDCLHLDGEDLLDRPASARRQALEQVAAALCVPRLVTAEEAAADAFLAGALRSGHEGCVAKALDAPYEAGRRGAGWLKVKPAHTLDLVVLAVEQGSGRRAPWLSNLHLGARGEDGGFVMLGKTFKGLTDALLRWQTVELGAREVAREGAVVHVRPELVVEVAFDGVQASSRYPGGVALRFARVRRYRPDKTPAEADTLAAVRALLPDLWPALRAGPKPEAR